MVDPYIASRAAEQAAYAAGTHLLASRSRLSASWVTRADPASVLADIERETGAMMREVLARHCPDLAMIDGAACRGALPDAPADDRPHWIAMPLDGRAHYARGEADYAVTIALVEADRVLLGVVYDPSRNEFFGAIHGCGSVLNGLPMHCAEPRPAPQATASTVFPARTSPAMARYVAEFGRVSSGFGDLRRSDSTALQLAHLAAGRIDAFWAHDIGPFDAPAGAALLEGSGARLYLRDGKPLRECRSMMGCTPTLFEPFLSLLAEA